MFNELIWMRAPKLTVRERDNWILVDIGEHTCCETFGKIGINRKKDIAKRLIDLRKLESYLPAE